MKLEVTKQNEETARHVSSGKRGLWLKEMVNIQSNLEDLQQQHPRPCAQHKILKSLGKFWTTERSQRHRGLCLKRLPTGISRVAIHLKSLIDEASSIEGDQQTTIVSPAIFLVPFRFEVRL
jgi:hypothetical protein